MSLWADAVLFASATWLDVPVVATQRVDKFCTHGVEHGGVVARGDVAHTPVGVRDWVHMPQVISLVGPGNVLREGSHGGGGMLEPIHREEGRSCQHAGDVVE